MFVRLIESIKESNNTNAPYGFIIWPNGEYEVAGGGNGEHHTVINKKLNLPDNQVFYEFFKKGGIRMTSEWNYGNGWSEEAFKKYWIEADRTKVSLKNIKLAKDLAIENGKKYEITHIPYEHFK